MGLAHLRMPGPAPGPQEAAHRRVLGLAQGPQESELVPRGPVRVKRPHVREHLRVLGLVKGPQGLERLRVRLMESPQLGE